MIVEKTTDSVTVRPTPVIRVENLKLQTLFFHPKEYFLPNISKGCLVKIEFVYQNFEQDFLGFGKKKEMLEDQSSFETTTNYTYRHIKYRFHSEDVFESIGKRVSTLHHIYAIMEIHAQAEKIGLRDMILADKNIFFAKDYDGVVKRIDLEKRKAGWWIISFGFEDRSMFIYPGTRVFFPHCFNLDNT